MPARTSSTWRTSRTMASPRATCCLTMANSVAVSRPGLAQDLVGDADLPDVVQQACHVDRLHRRVVEAEPIAPGRPRSGPRPPNVASCIGPSCRSRARAPAARRTAGGASAGGPVRRRARRRRRSPGLARMRVATESSSVAESASSGGRDPDADRDRQSLRGLELEATRRHGVRNARCRAEGRRRCGRGDDQELVRAVTGRRWCRETVQRRRAAATRRSASSPPA